MQAASLALVVAMVVVALEVVASRSKPGTLRLFVRNVYLVPVVNLGVAALIVSAYASSRFQSPLGWEVAIPVVLNVFSLVTVPMLIAHTIRVVDLDYLAGLRLRGIERLVDDVVHQQAVQTFTADWLSRMQRQRNLGFEPFLRQHTYAVLVRTPRRGVVKDIRIRKLKRLLRFFERLSAAPATVGLFTSIGSNVDENETVLGLPEDLGLAVQRRALRTIKLGRPSSSVTEELSTTQETLHDEAMDAIRGGRIRAYKDVALVYESTLLALPRAWQRFRHVLGSAAPYERSPFRLSITDRFVSAIERELDEAWRHADPEVRAAAMHTPYRVGQGAITAGAFDLAESMMVLYARVWSRAP